jgi:hypothetical protein
VSFIPADRRRRQRRFTLRADGPSGRASCFDAGGRVLEDLPRRLGRPSHPQSAFRLATCGEVRFRPPRRQMSRSAISKHSRRPPWSAVLRRAALLLPALLRHRSANPRTGVVAEERLRSCRRGRSRSNAGGRSRLGTPRSERGASRRQVTLAIASDVARHPALGLAGRVTCHPTIKAAGHVERRPAIRIAGRVERQTARLAGRVGGDPPAAGGAGRVDGLTRRRTRGRADRGSPPIAAMAACECWQSGACEHWAGICDGTGHWGSFIDSPKCPQAAFGKERRMSRRVSRDTSRR